MPSPAAQPARSDAAAPAHLAAAAVRAVLAEMAEELGPLLRQELERLSQARDAWRAGTDPNGLSLAAHDLRGLGALYGAPMTGRMAASLERLLGAGAASGSLVDAHVDAIAAVVREGAAGADDPRGGALAEALERAVRPVAVLRPPDAPAPAPRLPRAGPSSPGGSRPPRPAARSAGS